MQAIYNDRLKFNSHPKTAGAMLALIVISMLSTSICCAQEIAPNKNTKLAEVDSLLNNAKESQPMVVPPISFVDVNSGRFGKLEIDRRWSIFRYCSG
jgi:hypothetical protein